MFFMWQLHWNIQDGRRLMTPIMVAVGDNKIYREAKKNSLVIFTFKVVEGNSGCILNLFRKPYSMSFEWSFRQLIGFKTGSSQTTSWIFETKN